MCGKSHKIHVVTNAAAFVQTTVDMSKVEVMAMSHEEIERKAEMGNGPLKATVAPSNRLLHGAIILRCEYRLG